jgi:hypothetical protein
MFSGWREDLSQHAGQRPGGIGSVLLGAPRDVSVRTEQHGAAVVHLAQPHSVAVAVREPVSGPDVVDVDADTGGFDRGGGGPALPADPGKQAEVVVGDKVESRESYS